MIDRRLRRADHAKIVKKDGGTWEMVKEPLTKDDVNRHFNNGAKYGVPFIKQGEDVTIMAMIDLDDHDGSLGWDVMQEAATVISEALGAVGLNVNPYRSGGEAGINLWIAWEEVQDAHSVREKLREVIESVGFTSGANGVDSKEVEIFPKQDSIGFDENGNCAAIPRLPIDSLFFDDCEDYKWEDSQPVEVIERGEMIVSNAEQVSEAEIDELLSFISPEGFGYDEWWRVIMAIQSAGGTKEQAERWSRKHPEFMDEEINDRKWDSIRSDKGSMITVRSLMKFASDAGWEGFDVDVSVFPDAEVLVHYKRVPGKGRFGGYKMTTLEQVKLCMADDAEFPYIVVWDEFITDVMIADRDDVNFRRMTDNDYSHMRCWFDRNQWEPVNTQMIRDAVGVVAEGRTVNSAMSWADNLQWDGVDRYDHLLKSMGAPITDYYKAIIRYQWTSQAARLLEPGYQADAIVVFVSEQQGTGKTQLINGLAPIIAGVDTYKNIQIDDILDSDRAARVLRGCLIANMDEMRNFTKREQAGIKAALSRMKEGWTPKYKERFTEFGRTCLIYATNNQFEFMDDETGDRRYHPIVVGSVDLKWIKENRDQLWAQGIDDFKANGQAWKEALELAPDATKDHRTTDIWEDVVVDYLDTCIGNVTTSEILSNAINMDISRQHRGEQNRVGKILRKHGWKNKPVRENGKVVKRWVNSING
ncbi:MAG: PriCT-2 domain-containing protein [Deltaproteobacteria bacterium]|nr:PriCT-2 domain-containing protein [Deltaproteobacteria bacterium]